MWKGPGLRQLPALVEKAGGGDVRPLGSRFDLENGEVAEAGHAVFVGELAVLDGHAAVDDDVAAGGEGIREDHGGDMISGGEAGGAEGYLFAGPAERGFALELGDPAVAAGVAEEDEVVLGEVGGGDVFIVFDAGVGAEALGVEAVEASEHAEGLGVGFGMPRLTGGPDEEKRVHEGVVDGALLAVGLPEALGGFGEGPAAAGAFEGQLRGGFDGEGLAVDGELPGGGGFLEGEAGDVLGGNFVALAGVEAAGIDVGAVVVFG